MFSGKNQFGLRMPFAKNNYELNRNKFGLNHYKQMNFQKHCQPFRPKLYNQTKKKLHECETEYNRKPTDDFSMSTVPDYFDYSKNTDNQVIKFKTFYHN